MNVRPQAKQQPVERRQYQSSAREEQKRESQERILECAVRRFSDVGFDATSLRDIAGDAGVTHALVRAHFGSKEELWRATMDYLIAQQGHENVFSPYADMTRMTVEDVRRFIHEYVGHSARHSDALQILLREGAGPLNDRMKWFIDNHVDRLTRPVIHLLERAMQDGVIVAMPTHVLVSVIASLSQTVFASWGQIKYRFDVDITTPEEVKRYADIVCRLIIRE